MARPWRALALAQIAFAACAVVVALLVMRPRQEETARLRQAMAHCAAEALELERGLADGPAQARLDAALNRLSLRLARQEAANMAPAAFIAAVQPGRAENIAWQSLSAQSGQEPPYDRWRLSVTTDFTGLRHMLGKVSRLEGLMALESLTVTGEGLRLHAELLLSSHERAGEKNGLEAEKTTGVKEVTQAEMMVLAKEAIEAETTAAAKEAGEAEIKAAVKAFRDSETAAAVQAYSTAHNTATRQQPAALRDPFQPVAAQKSGPAVPGRAAEKAIKGKVGSDGRWWFWAPDSRGRWRRYEPAPATETQRRVHDKPVFMQKEDKS